MDAQISGHSVTPRRGKPVEIQALWINALRIGSLYDPRWEGAAERAAAEFTVRFWNPDRGFLYDVIDGDGVAGKNDATLRPNQILAIGGLPFPVLQGPRARAVVEVVERELVTPMGLRTLGSQEPGYRGVYTGDPTTRDMAYHQGTVWAWLMGPFVDAWLAVGGNTPARRLEARHRFVEPLLRHLEEAGLGHISEIADGDAPFTPRGAPFQAWSVAELLRIELLTR
jgi:predicted glycogen debranching enzyme